MICFLRKRLKTLFSKKRMGMFNKNAMAIPAMNGESTEIKSPMVLPTS